jgi:hypothetical protein
MLNKFFLRSLIFLVGFSLSTVAASSIDYDIEISNTGGLEIFCSGDEYMKQWPYPKGSAIYDMMLNMLNVSSAINGYMSDPENGACKIRVLEPTDRKFQFSFDTEGGKYTLECSQDWIDAYFNSQKTPGYEYSEAQQKMMEAQREQILKVYGMQTIEGKQTGFECSVLSAPRKGGVSRLASLVGAKTNKQERKVAKPKTKSELRLERLKRDLLSVQSSAWRDENGAIVKLTRQDFWFAVSKGDKELKQLILKFNKQKSGILKMELARISDYLTPTFYQRYKDPKFITEFEEPIFEYLNQNIEDGVIISPEMFAGVFYVVWADIYEAVAGYNQSYPNVAEWNEKVNDKSLYDALVRYEGLADRIAFFNGADEDKKTRNLDRFNAEYPGVIKRFEFSRGE